MGRRGCSKPARKRGQNLDYLGRVGWRRRLHTLGWIWAARMGGTYLAVLLQEHT